MGGQARIAALGRTNNMADNVLDQIEASTLTAQLTNVTDKLYVLKTIHKRRWEQWDDKIQEQIQLMTEGKATTDDYTRILAELEPLATRIKHLERERQRLVQQRDARTQGIL